MKWSPIPKGSTKKGLVQFGRYRKYAVHTTQIIKTTRLAKASSLIYFAPTFHREVKVVQFTDLAWDLGDG
ncbi:MAG: hypothetical protein J6X44_14040 [Thermoguttaceae bacterium]|nr:hypothetical protein [Thermoguttaceae bacterium]